jgi:hypothetical protein
MGRYPLDRTSLLSLPMVVTPLSPLVMADLRSPFTPL